MQDQLLLALKDYESRSLDFRPGLMEKSMKNLMVKPYNLILKGFQSFNML